MKKCLLIIILFFSKNMFSQWSDVGLGTDARVTGVYVDSLSNTLFVGGTFQHAGQLAANNIATWDGSVWNNFGDNQPFSSPGYITSIINFNGSIIAAGLFDSIGSRRVNNIAIWDGGDWLPMNSGFNNSVYCLAVYKGELYAGGTFYYSGNDTIEGLAKWNGLKWVNVVDLDGDVFCFTIYKGKLVIAGDFIYNPIPFISKIISWDGMNIDTSMHGYFNNAIFSVNSFSDTLYATGSFTSIPINNSNYISVYYNNSWHSIGNPTGGQNWIKDAIVYHGKLYMCGYFLNPPDLCRYNGSGFDSIAVTAGVVEKLIEYKGNLYAAGSFNSLNGQAMHNIAKYNDANISINELTGDSGIFLQAFPNPSNNGRIILSIRDKLLVDKMCVNVYSLDNKLIFSESSNEFISEINLPIKNGVYIMDCIINDSKVEKIKLIVL